MSRVELAKISALTFYKDSLTEARRTKAIPQLICVGKPCKLYTPEVVRCQSLGGSGTEIDWKCEADLPDSLRFGRVEVGCEGWARPGDPYVLKGSCSLEYRLVQVPGSLRNSDSDNYSGGESQFFTVVWLAFVAVIAYSFLRSCMGQNQNQNRVGERPDPGRPGSYPGSGGYFPAVLMTTPPPAAYSKVALLPTPTQRRMETRFWTGAFLADWERTCERQDSRAYDWERERAFNRAPPLGRSTARSSEDRGAMEQSTGFGGSKCTMSYVTV
ncbi:DUF1183-domain-containing protein [Mycena leptocephala]|nr:DUF1183-domain-containing protein [Mycena leptocephala]